MARTKIKVPLLIDYLERRLGSCKTRGDEHEFYCPACLDRIGVDPTDRKLWVNTTKGAGYCYRCEFRFHSWEYLFKFLNGGILRPEELAILRRETMPPNGLLYPAVFDIVSVRRDDVEDAGLFPQPVPEDAVRLADAPRDKRTLRRAFSYLARRNVSSRLIERFDIRYCRWRKYGGHLIFPVWQGGEQVYFTTRSTLQNGPKSRNPENREGYFSRKTCLLNYDNVMGCRQVHLVEGPHDCMALDPAIGLMGKFMSPTHKQLIARLVDHGLEELVIALDADAGAEVDVLYRSLVGLVPTVSCLYLDHGDPDDRRDDLPDLLKDRRAPTTRDMVRARLVSRK